MQKNWETEAIILVENLTKSFNGKKAVDNLSFFVPKGSLFAFLGQNGAGKSTTINMLIGLVKKDSGEISYNGSREFSSFKKEIGVVFQNNLLDDFLTVRESLLLYGSLYLSHKKNIETRYKEIVSLLSLEEMEKKKFCTLSGGQKRKVEIARALFMSPQVLFLDEPTTGLDPKTRAEVWKILHTIRKKAGMTVFLTTHYMEETIDADQVVIINHGIKICEGSPAELKARYSFDRMLVTPENAEQLEKQLREKGILFEKTADTYMLRLENTEKSIELLYEFKDNIRFYEVKKGTMDDVFLNAVGEKMREDA